MLDQLNSLRALIQRHARGSLVGTRIPGVVLHNVAEPTTPQPGLYEPVICLVLQGAKEVTISGRTLRYDSTKFFIASVELPATGRVSEASVSRPYVAVGLDIDRELLASLLLTMPPTPQKETVAFGIHAVTPELLDGFWRLLNLLDAPEDVSVLGPLFKREILYRLLRTPEGQLLRQIAHAGSRASQVQRAIGWLRANYDDHCSVKELAEIAGMSRASFHRHFKAATAMSPLQYQKALRLQEARRLLVVDPEAQSAAYRVGYESASQFSREYARMFGCSPAQDAQRLRRMAIHQVSHEGKAAILPMI